MIRIKCAGCAPVNGADVEIWHCDVAVDYLQYGSQTASELITPAGSPSGGYSTTFQIGVAL